MLRRNTRLNTENIANRIEPVHWYHTVSMTCFLSDARLRLINNKMVSVGPRCSRSSITFLSKEIQHSCILLISLLIGYGLYQLRAWRFRKWFCCTRYLASRLFSSMSISWWKQARGCGTSFSRVISYGIIFKNWISRTTTYHNSWAGRITGVKLESQSRRKNRWSNLRQSLQLRLPTVRDIHSFWSVRYSIRYSETLRFNLKIKNLRLDSMWSFYYLHVRLGEFERGGSSYLSNAWPSRPVYLISL